MDLKPCKPTHHRPGSKEKIEVLANRVANGEELHHFADEWMLADKQEQEIAANYALISQKLKRDFKRKRKHEQ